jgi:hypothetical protein
MPPEPEIWRLRLQDGPGRSDGADMLMAVPPTLTLPHEGARKFTFLSVGEYRRFD